MTEPDVGVCKYKKLPSNPALEENPSRIYPENCMQVLIENFPQELFSFLYTGEEMVSSDGSKVVPLKVDMRKCLYGQAYTKFKELKNAEFALCLYTQTKLPMLRITQGDTALWVLFNMHSDKKEVTIQTDKHVYTASQWSDIANCFSKVERKEKMAIENSSIDSIIKNTLGVTANKVAFDPEKTGGENIAAEKQAKQEPAKEAPVAEAKEEATEPVKRTRKKAEVTKVQDLTKIIEQLGGAVPDNMPTEDVQREIRQCRDLILAATRRMANVSLSYIDKSAAAQAKLAAIKAAL